MTTTFLIPLLPQPQRFQIQLNSVLYNMVTRWVQGAAGDNDCWVLDIYDANNVPLLGGIALVTGANLLEQFEYLEFGGSFSVYDTTGPWWKVPDFNSLGITSGLYYTPFEQ